jgi:outer membrane protein assembly factor BamB
VARQRQLIVQTRLTLAGVDPEDGSVLWQQDVPTFRGMNVLTPTVWRESLFTTCYGGRSLAFDLVRQGTDWGVVERWSNKAQGYMSSPVVIGDFVYVHLRNQRFTCLDLKTGEARWISQPYGKYWSMVANGDQILALDQRGELLLIKATPQQFTLLGQRKISDEETWAHLAVAGRNVFVRHLHGLMALTWQQP